jgi:predicted HTH domain antitoxin
MSTKSKLDNLYDAFWGLIVLFQDAVRKKTIDNLLKGQAVDRFLLVTKDVPLRNIPKTKPSNVGFLSLPRVVQNLLMAVAEINMKLTNAEDEITLSLSQLYEQAAISATQCILNQMKSVQNFNSELRNRIVKLHNESEKQLMPQLKEFRLRTNHLLQNIEKLCVFEWNQDMSVRSLLISMNSAKRALQSLEAERKLPKIKPNPIISDDLDARITFRLEKNEIYKQQVHVTEMIKDPMELAKSLEILNIADLEATANLGGLEKIAATKIEQEEEPVFVADIEEFLAELLPNIDLGHVYLAETDRILSKISIEIEKEARDDLNHIHSISANTIQNIQHILKESREKCIADYESKIKATRDAEQVLFSEMVRHASNAPSLASCKRDINESTKQHKLARDLETLNIHKQILHKLANDLVKGV